LEKYKTGKRGTRLREKNSEVGRKRHKKYRARGGVLKKCKPARGKQGNVKKPTPGAGRKGIK